MELYDYLVVNDKLEESAEEVHHLVAAARRAPVRREEFVRGTIHLGKNNDIYLDDKIFDSRIFDRRYTADEAEVLCGFYKELQAFLKA